MKLRLALCVLLSLAATSATAEPAGVTSARASGQIGERYDGYIGVAGPISPAVRGQIGQINITRRSLYAQLAVRRGVTQQEVGITAGCSLLASTPVGGSYLLSDELWRHRKAGQAIALPSYCH